MNAQKHFVTAAPVNAPAGHTSTVAESLPLNDMVEFFAAQLARYVRYDSFEYCNRQHATYLNRGLPGIHSCNYQIATQGIELGRITFTRALPFENKEIDRIESALGVLSMQLGRAIEMLRAEAVADRACEC